MIDRQSTAIIKPWGLIMSRWIEDSVINKLNGYYLILYGKDHLFCAGLILFLAHKIVQVLVLTHIIPPRIHA